MRNRRGAARPSPANTASEMHDGAAIYLYHVQQALFLDDGNSPSRPKPALLTSRSISIPFSFVKAIFFFRCARLRQIRSENFSFHFVLRLSARASSSRRSLRRAVSTICVPPAANSSAAPRRCPRSLP